MFKMLKVLNVFKVLNAPIRVKESRSQGVKVVECVEGLGSLPQAMKGRG